MKKKKKLKNSNVDKLKNSNSDKTLKLQFGQNSISEETTLKSLLVKTTLHLSATNELYSEKPLEILWCFQYFPIYSQ